MTEGKRIHEGTEDVSMYKTAEPAPDHTTDVVATQSTDRVSWVAVFAGIFTTLVILIGLTILGLVLGLETIAANDQISGFRVHIWSFISALVSFLLGAFVAARGAAYMGRSRSMLNGTMVLIVAIPLMISLLGTVGDETGSVPNIAALLVDNTAVQTTNTDTAWNILLALGITACTMLGAYWGSKISDDNMTNTDHAS